MRKDSFFSSNFILESILFIGFCKNTQSDYESKQFSDNNLCCYLNTAYLKNSSWPVKQTNSDGDGQLPSDD